MSFSVSPSCENRKRQNLQSKGLRPALQGGPGHVRCERQETSDDESEPEFRGFRGKVWIPGPVYTTAKAYLEGQAIEADHAPVYETHLTGAGKATFFKGAELFSREGHCITCHQADGKGLPAAQFPPLASSEWVTGSQERLIKLTLNGLQGPIEVNGAKFPGIVPMIPYKVFNDEEVASVLTFVRNTFGNRASVVKPETVKKIRAATKEKVGFYTSAELLKAHPK
ncbi:MAG: cytochrome c [Planctomycetota bacterium]|nr:cytochrome c [Planctomycetota bacterium]